LPDYGFFRMGAVIGYIISAFIGIILICGLIWIISRRINGKKIKTPDIKGETS
jgi:hypothetical protein